MAFINVPKVLSFTQHPFTGVTVNGIAYGTIVNVGAVAANEVVIATSIMNVIPHGYPGYSGKFYEAFLQFTAQVGPKTEATNAQVIYRIQGRNEAPQAAAAWVDIVANTTILPPATGWPVASNKMDVNYMGWISPSAGFNAVPFTIRMVVASNSASNVQGRSNSATYATISYRID